MYKGEDMSQDKKFDVRNIERNLTSKKVKKEDYAEYLASLEDCSDLMDDCETQFMHKSKKEAEKAQEELEE